MKLKWQNDNSIKSPLGRARGLGASRDGVEHWWHQRITSIANIPLILWLICSVTMMPSWSHDEFVLWLGSPVNAILMILSLISIFYHAALGTQVIIEDYVHHEGFKFLKLISMKLFFFAAGIACIFSVLKISFSG